MDNNTSGKLIDAIKIIPQTLNFILYAASRKMILKPASLKKSEQQNGNSTNENGNSFAFSNNPFLKCDKDEQQTTTTSESNSSHPVEASTATTTTTTKSESNPSDLFKPAKPANLFTNATTLAENSNFVFGQNLHARVVMVGPKKALQSHFLMIIIYQDKVPTPEGNNDENKEKADGLLLFSSALFSNSDKNSSEEVTQPVPKDFLLPDDKNDTKDEISQATAAAGGGVESTSNNGSSTNNMSLVEAARKYEEMKGALKRKYEEVETITGEEDEENIIEINCKLYTFENSNYEERGRGTLRLNDTKSSSRVVFRASGSYRVLLNTKVWGDQQCEKSSSKSLRLTAFNSEGLLKIYLVQGRNEDIAELHHELQRRIDREKIKIPDKEEVKDDEKEGAEPANKKLLAPIDE